MPSTCPAWPSTMSGKQKQVPNYTCLLWPCLVNCIYSSSTLILLYLLYLYNIFNLWYELNNFSSPLHWKRPNKRFTLNWIHPAEIFLHHYMLINSEKKVKKQRWMRRACNGQNIYFHSIKSDTSEHFFLKDRQIYSFSFTDMVLWLRRVYENATKHLEQ